MTTDELRKRIDRFMTIRNESAFNSNLQFNIDLKEAGLTHEQIGKACRRPVGGWRWDTDAGSFVEQAEGRMEWEDIALAREFLHGVNDLLRK